MLREAFEDFDSKGRFFQQYAKNKQKEIERINETVANCDNDIDIYK